MGREFDDHSDDGEFENYHPGCMGGIFNVLDSHHWYNVKKMLPHRKYNRGRHSRCCAKPQTLSMEREKGENQGLLDGETGRNQVQKQTRKTGSTNKLSVKAYTKGLNGKEKAKEESHKHLMLGFSSRKHQQTDSNHHMVAPGSGLGWMNPIIFVPKRADNYETNSTFSLPETPQKQVTKSEKSDIHDKLNAESNLELKEVGNQKPFETKRGTRVLINQKKPMSRKLNISDNEVKEGVDVLEIFKVNKDLFLDILQDPVVGISQHFPGNQTLKTVTLTKSVSFPVPNLIQTRHLRSSTLEHKQKEVWSFRKGENSKPRDLGNDDCVRSIVKEEASSSSQGSDHQRWNHLVMNRLKYIKQIIKQALKEKRKSINLPVSSRAALSRNEGGLSESLEKNNASDHYPSNGGLNRIRRTSSINESLERYTQLFENSISKESILHHSKSLKLTNEDKVASRSRAPKFFRRISSLSDLEFFCSLLHEVSRDTFSSEIPIRDVLNYDANNENDGNSDPKSISFPEGIDKFELVEAVLEAELQGKMIEGDKHSSTGLLADRNQEEITKSCDSSEDRVELPMEKRSSNQEESAFTGQTSDPDVTTVRADCPISEGLPADEADNTISRAIFEQETMGFSGHFTFFESDREADPFFNYVRDLLELSGLIKSEYLQTWHSPDQPLSPSLFKELELLSHPEMEFSIDEIGSNCDHQLVFDLVNEALLEISDRSSTHFPKPFSFNRGISQMLKGNNNVLQEVWTKVNKNLTFQPEPDQSLDDIVARDLARDAWMNIQSDTESLTFELEDLIVDELLDEVLFKIAMV